MSTQPTQEQIEQAKKWCADQGLLALDEHGFQRPEDYEGDHAAKMCAAYHAHASRSDHQAIINHQFQMSEASHRTVRSFSLSPAVMAEVEARAKAENRTVSRMVEVILANGVKTLSPSSESRQWISVDIALPDDNGKEVELMDAKGRIGSGHVMWTPFVVIDRTPHPTNPIFNGWMIEAGPDLKALLNTPSDGTEQTPR